MPILQTDRQRLRGFAERDIASSAAMLVDPEVVRYLADGRPLSPRDCWREIAMMLGHWLLRSVGLWAVEKRATGALVGRVGSLESTGGPGFP
ncbi:MAG: GNAT family N-acetyltransferase [Gemmatimonadales bacterium]